MQQVRWIIRWSSGMIRFGTLGICNDVPVHELAPQVLILEPLSHMHLKPSSGSTHYSFSRHFCLHKIVFYATHEFAYEVLLLKVYAANRRSHPTRRLCRFLSGTGEKGEMKSTNIPNLNHAKWNESKLLQRWTCGPSISMRSPKFRFKFGEQSKILSRTLISGTARCRLKTTVSYPRVHILEISHFLAPCWNSTLCRIMWAKIFLVKELNR